VGGEEEKFLVGTCILSEEEKRGGGTGKREEKDLISRKGWQCE